jgi:methionine salvage enolase-phosphatase E1
MQLSKEKLQHFVNNMPEKMDVVEIFDKVLLMAKIEQANEEVINQYAPQDELEKEIDLWA